MEPSVKPYCEPEAVSPVEAERVARELGDAAIASAAALAREAKSVDPEYAARPTAFLYKGATAQIATSTAGMYGEMIESFVKQVRKGDLGDGVELARSADRVSSKIKTECPEKL